MAQEIKDKAINWVDKNNSNLNCPTFLHMVWLWRSWSNFIAPLKGSHATWS
jgi:hypothetical protein